MKLDEKGIEAAMVSSDAFFDMSTNMDREIGQRALIVEIITAYLREANRLRPMSELAQAGMSSVLLRDPERYWVIGDSTGPNEVHVERYGGMTCNASWHAGWLPLPEPVETTDAAI